MTISQNSLTTALFYIVSGLFTSSIACTSIVITKGATVDGSTLLSYSADSHNLYGELYHRPAANHPEGTTINIYEWDTGKYLGEIPQVKQTYGVIGNMNEYQVTIGETTFGGREELVDTTGILDYGNLIYIALQRSKTAREAIDVMTSLVKAYGYYSSGESFSIADPNEVWIMEMIGKGPGERGANWVAVKIPDGMASAHANQARITTFVQNSPKTCLFSPDIIKFATSKGYFIGSNKEFSFADAFAPLDYGALRFCEARVWSAFRQMNPEMNKYLGYIKGDNQTRMPLFIKPTQKVSARDVMNIMRDHYEGTELDMKNDIGAGPFKVPYRFRPLTFTANDTTYFHERAIATQQTGFVFVAQMRSKLPNAVGGLLWFGVDDANSTVFMPIYCGINEVPPCIKEGNGDLITFTWNAAFWVFNWVANQAYGRYELMIPEIKKNQLELEDKFASNQAAIELTAKTLHEKNPVAARQYLTDYCWAQADQTMDKWVKLGQFLMVKFIDGNLHPSKNGKFIRNEYGRPADTEHPGYSETYYKSIADETGDKLLMKKIPNQK